MLECDTVYYDAAVHSCRPVMRSILLGVPACLCLVAVLSHSQQRFHREGTASRSFPVWRSSLKHVNCIGVYYYYCIVLLLAATASRNHHNNHISQNLANERKTILLSPVQNYS